MRELRSQVEALKEELFASKTESQFSSEIVKGIKSNFELKLSTYLSKMGSLISISDDKLNIYDERIQNLESTLQHKVKYVRNGSPLKQKPVGERPVFSSSN